MSYRIRVMGDPVLRQRAKEVDNIDGRIVQIVEDMTPAMYEAEGIGLAAPQVGIQKRLFVYDIGEGAQVLVNPEIIESRDEWSFVEGCLSDELLARLFQHELDHLDGVLLVDHLERDERKAAMRLWRETQNQSLPATDPLNGLSLP